jgi:hypothetical protein
METLKEDCPCPKLKCKRHGNCDVCEAYHGRKGRLPYCKRDNNNNNKYGGKIK